MCIRDSRTTPLAVLTYTTSRDTRWVKNFVVFIFAVLCPSAKTPKICTPRKLPAIRYVQSVVSNYKQCMYNVHILVIQLHDCWRHVHVVVVVVVMLCRPLCCVLVMGRYIEDGCNYYARNECHSCSCLYIHPSSSATM